MTNIRCTVCICILALLFFNACRNMGEELRPGMLPENLPALQEILNDLAKNDSKMRGFEGRGRAIVESPNLEAIQVLRQSDVYYQKPDALHVIGRRHGTTVFRLTGSSHGFLMEFPTERQFIHEPAESTAHTERIELNKGLYYRITPIDILHEMFHQEDWAHLPIENLELTSVTEIEGILTAHLDIYSRYGNYPRRRLLLGATPDWVVRHSILMDPENAEIIAETTLDNYRLIDGVRFPAEIDTVFPMHESRMQFSFTSINLNRPLDDQLFDLESQHAALMQRGFERITQEPKK